MNSNPYRDFSEMKKMLNLKARDYGLEPNVTGFEEAVNLSYLDGKRDGYDNAKLEDAKKLIELGIEDEIITEAIGLDLKTIQNLKKD